MKVFIVVLLIVVVFLVLHYLFPVIQICGDSMYPTYKGGEILLGYRIYRKDHLKVGDVILFQNTEDRRTVIKRIADIREEKGKLLFFVLGDNPEVSYDSRNYGYISSDRLTCRLFNQRRKLECM